VRWRFAVFARIFACCVLLSAPVFPQEPAPNSQPGNGSQNTGQKNPEQRPLPEPKVFFPMAEQPEMEMHHHGSIPEVMPQFPHLGDSQRIVPGPIYQLEDLEHMAAAHNPTLAQAQRAVEAARGRQRQSGLYPNPTIGYEGDEIRGGAYGGGEQGFFVEQPIILGGKLGLNRKVGGGEVKERQAEAEAQSFRVENDVRMAYYHTLAAQERLAIDRDLVTIAQTTVRVVRQLDNVGEADETEVLEAEAEEQGMEVAAGVSQHVLRREWEALISVVGVPSLPEGSVAGAIDTEIPSLDEGQLLASLLTSSPARKSAQAGVERAEAALRRSQHEVVPDITFKGGFQQNYELLNASPNREVGLQGFAEVGLHLHVWDRNQGGIATARADLEIAQDDLTRVDLTLRKRSAMYTEDYRSARLTADRYRTEILPRLQRAYALMTRQYGEMTASFIRVLNLQRMLYENETDYIEALEQAWISSVALRGFLLDGSLGDSTLTRDSFTREIESNRPAAPKAGQFVLPSNFAPQ
jgi:cobalt-zinc-cadmium efflux system outer membrane protein